jgi:MFS family permease
LPTSLPRLSPTARLLLSARGARSIGQGALVVDFALYLHALAWSGAAIGALLMASLLLGAALTLAFGPLSDRLGRKAFLIAYEAVQVLAASLALATSQPLLLAAATLLGSFGLGANGAAGPFGPVEQAWLAACMSRSDFGRVYSLNAAIGMFGMAVGAGLATTPGLLVRWLPGLLPGALAYRPLFALVLAGSLVTLLLLLRAREMPALPEAAGAALAGGAPPPQRPAERDRERQAENGLLARLVGINALNGLGIGLVGPLIAYWFALHFGVGPARIGPVLAGALVLSGLASLGTGWLSGRLGVIQAVVWMRLAGLVLLIGLPLAPSFGLAAAMFVLRSAFNRGTAGARQALSLSLVGPGRRGLAASLNTISMQIPRAVGPAVAGLFFDAGQLALPFFLSALFQGGYLLAYQRTFRAFSPRPLRASSGGAT